jgi:hypothetical protein
MTPDEREMLTDLANKIAQTPAPPRDPEAEEFIRTKIGNRPDALYLMTQTVLIQNMAMQQAQQQIQELQQRTSSSAGGSFLGQAPRSAGAGPYAAPPSGYPQQQQSYSAPPPQYSGPVATPPPSGGAPSFLRSAAQTAAGVAAGALAFEGIRGLFNSFEHPGGSGFSGAGFGGGFGDRPVEETVVNNYYDSPPGQDYGNERLGDLRDDRDTQDASYDDADSLADSDLVDDSGDYGDDDSGDSFA